jgi:hypothetical protein
VINLCHVQEAAIAIMVTCLTTKVEKDKAFKISDEEVGMILPAKPRLLCLSRGVEEVELLL